MRAPLLIGGLCALSLAASPKPKPTKATPAKPSPLEEANRTCRRDLAFGKLDAVRARCADLAPAASAIATYWRLALTDDPNDLRKGFAPAALAKGEVDARLLLLGGRYHFARGQVRETADLVEIGSKARLKGPEFDTLKRLATGK
jgi:hypothetical protein